LAKIIAVNQMPISFCSSEGFKQFMAVVEPNYKICKEGAIKSRMKVLRSSVTSPTETAGVDETSRTSSTISEI
jgi:hypothetical protein